MKKLQGEEGKKTCTLISGYEIVPCQGYPCQVTFNLKVLLQKLSFSTEHTCKIPTGKLFHIYSTKAPRKCWQESLWNVEKTSKSIHQANSKV